ncbi:SdrD B-like domain-containing protein [Candidatus Bipolaricaulota sp. J31]
MGRRRKWGVGVLSGFLLLAGYAGAWGEPYSIEITVTPPKVANPGEIVTHVFILHNLGSEDDLYLLDLRVPTGWEYFPKQDALFVPAGERGYLFVNLIVPEGAPAGSHELVLIATSSGDPTVSAEARTAVEVLPRWDLELRWVTPPRRLQVGEKDAWAFSLRNTGNVPDIYLVELELFGPCRAEVSEKEIHLLPGEEEVLEVRVEAPRDAETGSGYSLRIIATSAHDPGVRRELVASGRLLPPPPELVPTSLYPRWEVTLGVELDSEGNPRFSLRGSGDIEVFDYRVDAGIGLSLTELEELRLRWEGEGKSFYLHGGGISGLLLGVSGKPLFGGEIKGLGRWRALFSSEVKGVSLTGEGANTVFNFVWGTNALGVSFCDFGLRWDATEELSLRAGISQGADVTSAGQALQLGGELSREGFRLGAIYLQVSPGYPRQTPRDELTLRWTSREGTFPLDVTYRFAAVASGPPPGTLLSHEARVSSALDVPLRPAFTLGYLRRFRLPLPFEVDEWSLNVRASVRGREPFSWTLSATSSFREDLAAGTTAETLGLSGTVTVRTDILELSFNAGVSAAFGEGAGPPSSSFTLRLRFPGTVGTPTVTFRAGGERTALTVSLRDIPTGDGEGDASFSYTLEGGRSRWEAAFSLSFPADFPFLGPTRGRIRGRVFVDRDGDLAFSSGDEGVEGIIIEADGFEAITGAGGLFVFPPLLPGVYRLSFVDIPPELVPAAPLPVVEVSRGEEEIVEIPLRPRAWLKGLVFHDADKDGKRDPDEGGIPGVEIAIKGERAEWTVETDATGLFSLELPPGRYTVMLIEGSLPERFVPTTPTSLELEVPEYGVTEVAFGAYRKPKPVVVTFGPPIAEIDYAPERPRVGEPVRFSGARSRAFNAEIVSYKWEFRLGDRVIKAQGAEVTVSFPAAGRWTVILLVTDSNGLIGAKKVIVEVVP